MVLYAFPTQVNAAGGHEPKLELLMLRSIESQRANAAYWRSSAVLHAGAAAHSGLASSREQVRAPVFARVFFLGCHQPLGPAFSCHVF